MNAEKIRLRLGMAVTASIAFASLPSAGAEASRPVALKWTAPDGCPSEREILDEIAETMGPAPREGLVARASVQQGDSGWTADIDLAAAGETSSRRVEGETCRGLADAVVLMVALAAAPAAPPPREAPAAREPRPERPPEAAPRAREWALGAEMLTDAGTLPDVAFGGSARLTRMVGHARFGVDGALLAPVRGAVSGRADEGADFWLARVGLRGCYETPLGPFEVGPCAGAGMEWTTANGTGSKAPANATGRAVVLSFGTVGKWQLSRWIGLRAGVETVLPTHRPTYVIDGAGDVFRPPALALRLAVGAEMHF